MFVVLLVIGSILSGVRASGNPGAVHSDCLDPTHSTGAPLQYEGRVELTGVIFPPVEPVQTAAAQPTGAAVVGKLRRAKAVPAHSRIGQKFGSLTIVGVAPHDKNTRVYVQCDCGSPVKQVQLSHLRSRKHPTCGACSGRVTRQDRVGEVYGRLTIVAPSKTDKNSVVVRCECGVVKEVNLGNLRRGTRSCGACVIHPQYRVDHTILLPHNAAPQHSGSAWVYMFKNIAGEVIRVGSTSHPRERMIDYVDNEPYADQIASVHWVVARDFRHALEIEAALQDTYAPIYNVNRAIRRAELRSRGEAEGDKGGLATSQSLSKAYPNLYAMWSSMRKRKRSRKRYRDIRICEEWESAENFIRDMMPSDGRDVPRGLQLDRIDGSGAYEKSNCRIVTPKKNTNNREPTVSCLVDRLATWMPLSDASVVMGVSVAALRQRIPVGKLPVVRGGDLVRQAATRELRESRALEYATADDAVAFAMWFNGWTRANAAYRIEQGKSQRMKPNTSRTPSEGTLRFIASRSPLYLRALAQAKIAAAYSNNSAAADAKRAA